VVDVEQYTKDRKHPFPIPLVNDEEEREQKVTKSLEELDQAAEGSKADVLGKLVEAATLVREGKHADAETAYRGFLEAHPGHEFEFMAREGLAFSLEGQGNVDGALAEFETLIGNEGDFYRDQALWQKGRILEEQGKADEALSVYKQYAQEYPLEEASIARQQVTERLQELAPDLVPKPEEGAGGLGQLGLPPGLGQ
jgi:TolA-binding protein